MVTGGPMDVNQLLQAKITEQIGSLVFQVTLKDAQLELLTEENKQLKDQLNQKDVGQKEK
jgi:hypothetical protein